MFAITCLISDGPFFKKAALPWSTELWSSTTSSPYSQFIDSISLVPLHGSSSS